MYFPYKQWHRFLSQLILGHRPTWASEHEGAKPPQGEVWRGRGAKNPGKRNVFEGGLWKARLRLPNGRLEDLLPLACPPKKALSSNAKSTFSPFGEPRFAERCPNLNNCIWHDHTLPRCRTHTLRPLPPPPASPPPPRRPLRWAWDLSIFFIFLGTINLTKHFSRKTNENFLTSRTQAFPMVSNDFTHNKLNNPIIV